jgi:radical SAM superfamily enzyme YgiQ (UPF0313 family)
MKNVKVALIFPKLVDSIDRFDASFWLTDKLKTLFGLGKTNYTPPLSLLMLAAVTPPDIDIEIIDERLEEIDFDREVDLVGISVVTRSAYHAYDIAREFRQRGVKVVLGGIHPTVLPNEALEHADVVVRNQGEQIWPQLLHDYQQGEMKPIYDGELSVPFESLPLPRRDLIKHPELYLTTKVIAATRGCPYSCTFCTSGVAIGREYRVRKVAEVVKEIESIPGQYVVFLDDNLGVDRKFAKELFSALIPSKVRWAGAISVNALSDEQLVQLAAKSGCMSLGVGFESLSQKTLKAMGKLKTNNPGDYEMLVTRLHDSGILIYGYFLLGYDPDTPATYEQLTDFIEENHIEMPSINVLIPYPGTPIYEQFERENRILHKNWDLYDSAGGYVVYQPKNMTREQLVESYLRMTQRIYSYPSMVSRILGAGHFAPFASAWAFHYNYQHRQSAAAERKQGII